VCVSVCVCECVCVRERVCTIDLSTIEIVDFCIPSHFSTSYSWDLNRTSSVVSKTELETQIQLASFTTVKELNITNTTRNSVLKRIATQFDRIKPGTQYGSMFLKRHGIQF